MIRNLFLAAVCIILLTGCAVKEEKPTQDSLPYSEQDSTTYAMGKPQESWGYTGPTGYPSGGVQWQYVMINNLLYDNAAESTDKLPEGFERSVATKERLLRDMPTENLQGTYLDVGTVFYYNEEDTSVVYELLDSGSYRLFKVCDEAAWERGQPKERPDGEILWQYVVINGLLYENFAEYYDELPEGFDCSAVTAEKLFNEMPTENLQATRLKVGTVFYYNEDDTSVVYLDQGDDWAKCRYVQFVLSEQEQ